MRFRKNLYLSPTVRRTDKLMLKLRSGRGDRELYVLVFNHDSNRLEFYHNGILKQKLIHKRCDDIVGLATSREECMDLVQRIVQDAKTATGEYDIPGYLSECEKI